MQEILSVGIVEHQNTLQFIMLYQKHLKVLVPQATVFYFVESVIEDCTKERGILMAVKNRNIAEEIAEETTEDNW
jgi:hypothetical protein